MLEINCKYFSSKDEFRLNIVRNVFFTA